MNVKVTLALFIAVLLMVSPVLGDISSPEEMNTGVMNPYLRAELARSQDFDEIELLVQFEGGYQDQDVRAINAAGLEIQHFFTGSQAVYATGPARSVQLLSQYHRVHWMEVNRLLYQAMDESTATINATTTWNAPILSPEGRESSPIDGSAMLVNGKRVPVTVVVVDTGVDAGHPDLPYKEKVIVNLKSNTDFIYTEDANTDTSSGHGTHCAGTVAGNGEASSGARKGVAPGANLIGISTGEAVVILNALGALEWIYEHSKPGANPYNIRVASNSWGSPGEYYSEDAVMQVIRALTYENNVVVVFAAGNDGSKNHDGSIVTTNPYSLEPAALSIAAIERDGSGIAVFSSRGIADDNFTWPDIGAPGVAIQSTQARGTYITAMTTYNDIIVEFEEEAYYMAISGTSMATPHIAGIAALLWEAAPSMRVSSVHDDYQGDDVGYWNNSETRIHEAELIMKLASRYITVAPENGVPPNGSGGMAGIINDYAQGYGMVNVQDAVALALTLEELRRDDKSATVWDALEYYKDIISNRTVTAETDTLVAEWKGQVSNMNVDSTPSRDREVFKSFPHYLYIPPMTTTVDLALQYSAIGPATLQVTSLYLSIDYNGDGSVDWSGPTMDRSGNVENTIDVSGEMADQVWQFNINGLLASASPINIINREDKGVQDYPEAFASYMVSAQMTLGITPDTNLTISMPRYKSDLSALYFAPPSPAYIGGEIGMEQPIFDLGGISPKEIAPVQQEPEGFPWWLVILLVVIAIGIAVVVLRKREQAIGQNIGEESGLDEHQD